LPAGRAQAHRMTRRSMAYGRVGILVALLARPASAQLGGPSSYPAPPRLSTFRFPDPQQATPPPATSQALFPTVAAFPPTEAPAGSADPRLAVAPPLELPLDPTSYRVDKGDVLAARLWGEQNFEF